MIAVAESFEAYGRRRNGSSWSGDPSAPDLTAIGNTTRDGFTSHEQLDTLNLIHMNGRVYDPVVGRFMSADPYIQAPFNSQSLNRYSYVWNSSLSLTDPSGFQARSGSPDQPQEVCIDSDVCYTWNGITFSLSFGWTPRGYPNSAERDGCGQDGSHFLCTIRPRIVFVPASPVSNVASGPSAGMDWAGLATSIAVIDGPQMGPADVLALALIVGATVFDSIQATQDRESYRVYVTYTLVNPMTGQRYYGRTSGFDSPDRLVRARYSHHGDLRREGFVIDQSGGVGFDRAAIGDVGRLAIRGREQQLIDAAGGVGDMRVRNRIRAVSRCNPRGRLYQDQSDASFGNIAPYTGNLSLILTDPISCAR